MDDSSDKHYAIPYMHASPTGTMGIMWSQAQGKYFLYLFVAQPLVPGSDLFTPVEYTPSAVWMFAESDLMEVFRHVQGLKEKKESLQDGQYEYDDDEDTWKRLD